MRHLIGYTALLLLTPVLAYADTGGHIDPIASVLLVFTSLFFFALIGRYLTNYLNLGVISDDLFSAIVLMVIITTFIAPPLLKARYNRRNIM